MSLCDFVDLYFWLSLASIILLFYTGITKKINVITYSMKLIYETGKYICC